MAHILIVEDEPTLQRLLSNNLTFEGFTVQAVGDGEAALESLRTRPADLVVLDLMLPGKDGFQVLRALREAGNPVPVMMLTARGAENDRLMGLRSGADDYLVKPFSVLELTARIRAILRRTQVQSGAGVLRSGPFQIHRRKKQIYLKGQSLNLTSLEFRLVELLTANPGVPLSREELSSMTWGPEAPTARRTLNVHIANLRKKLAEGGTEEWIVTVGRVGRSGYLWSAPVQAEPQDLA